MVIRSKRNSIPVWRNPWVLFITYILLTVGALYLMYYLKSIFIPLLAAFFLAYILDPLVTKLDKPFLPRALIAGLVVIIIIFILILLLTFILPELFEQIIAFFNNIPMYLEKLSDLIEPLIKRFEADYPVELEKLSSSLNTEIENKLPDIASTMSNFVLNMFSNVLNFVLSIIKLILVPIFTFFLLKDFPEIRKTIKEYLPFKYRSQIIDIIREIDAVLGQYLRGQLLICFVIGVYYTTGFILIGVPFGYLLGIMIGLVNFVPYLGIFVGVIPALLLTFLEYGTFSKILLIALLYIAQQIWDGMFFTPKILGDKVGLHPVVILLSLMIFGKLFGIFGILVAVPVAAVSKVFIKRILKSYKTKYVVTKTQSP